MDGYRGNAPAHMAEPASAGSLRALSEHGRFAEFYELGAKLGQGTYSEVFVAKHNVTGDLVAVKRVRKQGFSDENLARLEREIRILRKLKHPNIIRFYALFDEEEHFFIVQELLTGGELFDRIAAREYYTENDAREVARTLLRTVGFLHRQGIIHRDIKPENILLASETSDTDIKLCDFGFAKNVVVGIGEVHGVRGTLGYIAPEVLTNSSYDFKADIWSLGVVFYIMLAGYSPFYAEDQAKQIELIKTCAYEFQPDFWSHVSNDGKDLIAHMLVLDPKERWSCDQLLKHQWFDDPAEELSSHEITDHLRELRRYQEDLKRTRGDDSEVSSLAGDVASLTTAGN